MKNRLLVAAVGVPLILLVLFVLPEPLTPTAIALLSAIGTYEAMHAIGMNHPRIALYTAVVAMIVPFWVYGGESRTVALAVLLVYLILVFVEAFLSRFRVKIERVGSALFFALVISYCLSSIVRIGMMDLRTSYILLPIALPFAVDAAAMLTGMFMKKRKGEEGVRKLAPVLSPKKTVEGSIGGLVGGLVIALLYGLVFHFITEVTVNYYFLAVYGILGAVVSEFGDLSFSYIKRTRKIKDFGTLLPGHGGVLDRFDSVIFCAPLVEILIDWIPVFK
ncbi:MAG: phosphatidate cytidylyltransferase [Ruminiclostridium sp.]|nr:phosphatidate cytidylyltransferase [Ruminiclostridium sp.]MBQ9933824.1 phosphatidate cytidylyltransferase [Ruminiclostridium sp.]